MSQLPLIGIAELYCWVAHMPDRDWRTGHEVEDCLQAHLDCGIKEVAWKLGRSVIEHHSDLPRATLFTGVGHPAPWAEELGRMFGERCCLRAALEFAGEHDMAITGRLGMNRHYSKDAHGGCFTSRWAAEHPEFYEVSKEGDPDPSRMCYALEEVRQERIDLLVEAARIGVAGLQLDFCRQPPTARYHPELVESFHRETGLCANDLDPWDESDDFVAWLRHRAAPITQMLRDLHGALEPVRQETGRPIPVQVRVPDNGLPVDLMAGLDVSTWCREGIIQELSVSSLNWLADFQEHDFSPYAEMGRQHGVRTFGGVNALAIQRVSGALPSARQMNPVRLAERALRQFDEGAQGMTLYQSDFAVWPEELREVLPRLGAPEALRAYATDEANRRRWPTTHHNLLYGVDNHSKPSGQYHVQGRVPGV